MNVPKPRRQAYRFRPQVEALEERAVPAGVSFELTEGQLLKIHGSPGDDSIELFEQGDGNLVLSFDTQVHTIDGVAFLKVDMGAGNDTVTHRIVNRLSSNTYNFDLGIGDDVMTSDFVDVNVSHPLFQMRIACNSGDDRVNINMSGGEITDLFNLKVRGDGDKDEIRVVMRDVDIIKLDPDDTFEIDIDGGIDKDVIDLQYSGQIVSAAMNFILTGGADDDQITADVLFNPGSSGTLSGSIDGQLGDDRMTFFVHKNPADDDLGISAKVHGGWGHDQANITEGLVLADPDDVEEIFVF